jgi:very-short-patch-repair endonuclease
VHELLPLLGPARTTSTTALARRTSTRSVGRWLASGRLVRVFPGWVTVPELADEWLVRAQAATGYTGGVLSHVSALAAHGVTDVETTRLHVTVPIDRRVRSSTWLRVHRSGRRTAVVRTRGLLATALDRTIVDAWGDAHRSRAERGAVPLVRGALIAAVRERRITVAAVAEQLGRRPEVPGRAALTDLLGLLQEGCRSELEIFGVLQVLRVAELPPYRQQFPVALPHGTVWLDVAWPEVGLAIELDGAAFHGSRSARERDLRRDAALAAQGWLVLRFSYDRLTREPDACRAQIRAVYAQRLSAVPTAARSERLLAAWGTTLPRR